MSSNPQAPTPAAPISEQEVASLRQNLTLLRSQLQAGRIDESFLNRQVDSLLEMMGRLGEERKQRRKEGRFQAIYEVSRAIGSSLDLQTVLDQVMDAIIKLTGAERGFLMLRDDDGGLAVKAARNLDQQTLGSEQFQFSRTVANQVLDARNPVLTNNAVEDPRFAGQKSIVSQALRSIMATPLRARGTVIGVVYVDNRMMSGLFTEDDLAALDTFAGQAAVAIDNARLFSATDQALAARVEELQTLRRIDLQLNETLDADKAMQIALDWALRLSGARVGYLGLVAEGRVKQVRQSGEAAADAPAYLDDSYPHVLKVVDSGIALLTTTDSISRLIVPIKREAQVIGVVLVERMDDTAFTTEQQDLVERVVARAAVTIENARLYAAVRAADLAKSEFVGIVAHDLKVPMTSIMGYSDLAMRMGDVNDRQREFLQKVKDTVKRMAVLVSDLADISRIEGGHFYMDERRVTVADIVRAVEDASITQVQEYQHEYAQEIEPELPDMQVDYYRLLQVLTNFVSNAFKYTPNGGKVTFRVRRTPDARIEFSVQDTGIGLTAEQVAKLGTKFWRAEDEFTRSRPGTGLGFAITRSLVEQMGSRVQIESTPGKGSTFKFSVRMAE
jgi:K+-sensing histidine kinase KdpD